MTRTRFVVALQLGSVGLGYALGAACYPTEWPSTFALLAALAAGMLSVDTACRMGVRTGPRRVIVLDLVMLVYMALTAFAEPFLDIASPLAAVIATIWFVVPLLALGALVRAGSPLAVAAVSLFIFASAAMLASNAGAFERGSGFLCYWRRG